MGHNVLLHNFRNHDGAKKKSFFNITLRLEVTVKTSLLHFVSVSCWYGPKQTHFSTQQVGFTMFFLHASIRRSHLQPQTHGLPTW